MCTPPSAAMQQQCNRTERAGQLAVASTACCAAEAWAWRLEDLGALAGEASSEQLAAHLRRFLPPSAVAAAAQR